MSEILDEIYIENAGLVITNSFIPMLFERSGLIESDQFISSEAQQKGALLLQYILMDHPPIDELQLPLNKVLCGLSITSPIETSLELTKEESKLIDGMIEAIIQHWSAIGSSSVEGFRGSWLWRKGRLDHDNESWVLRVEQNSYDMLLDRLPFSISPIKYAWMEKPIIVEWR